MSAYCVKCKQKREMKNPQKVTMKNGKPAMKGTCPVCGTGMYRIGESGGKKKSGGKRRRSSSGKRRVAHRAR